LSITPPFRCRLKRRKALKPCRLRQRTRLYTRLVCRNHGSWWRDLSPQCFRIGAQSTSSFVHASKCQSEWSSEGLERKRSIPLALCAQEVMEQSWERMRIMPSLCKCK
jgi:hypothetical protein